MFGNFFLNKLVKINLIILLSKPLLVDSTPLRGRSDVMTGFFHRFQNKKCFSFFSEGNVADKLATSY